MTSLEYKGKRHLPLPKGPCTVGCTDIMTGDSIKGTFMRLYYPSTETGTLEHYDRWPLWAPSMKYIEGYAMSSLFPFLAKRLLNTYCGDMHIPAILDAEPVLAVRHLPLVVFSHGVFGCRTTNSTTHVELASHGFVVASIEHRDQSAGYTYYIKSSPSTSKVLTQSGSEKDKYDEPKNSLYNSAQELKSYASNIEEVPVPFLERPLSRRYAALRNKQVHQRAEECSRALDLLRDINEGTAPRNVLETNCDLKKFQGLFDMTKVALAGHSFGGATTLMGLVTDPRFRVGLTLDPWMIPLEMENRMYSRLTQAVLFIKSPNFYDNKSLRTLKEFSSSEVERKYVTICGTSHLSQCDMPFMIPNIFNIFNRWGRMKGDMFTHMDIHNRLMMTFLSKYLDLPINADYENYIQSMSSQIQSGVEIADRTLGYMFLLPVCIFLGVIASLVYWFKKEETLPE